MMRCEFGFCLICDKEIAPKCGSCGSRKPGSQYTEVMLEWSNKSKMRTAICVDCAITNQHALFKHKKAMTDAHFEAWDKTGGHYDREIVIV